jgi:hypothetical protein
MPASTVLCQNGCLMVQPVSKSIVPYQTTITIRNITTVQQQQQQHGHDHSAMAIPPPHFAVVDDRYILLHYIPWSLPNREL